MARIRREVADILALAPEDVPEDGNLIEIGLHSLAIMALIGPLSRLAGRRLDYAELAVSPTLRDWQALIRGEKDDTRLFPCGRRRPEGADEGETRLGQPITL